MNFKQSFSPMRFWTYVMIGCVLYFFAIISTSLIGQADGFKDDPLAQDPV